MFSQSLGEQTQIPAHSNTPIHSLQTQAFSVVDPKTQGHVFQAKSRPLQTSKKFFLPIWPSDVNKSGPKFHIIFKNIRFPGPFDPEKPGKYG